jgi:hypothetical protein
MGVGFSTNYGHLCIGKLCATIRNEVMMALKQSITINKTYFSLLGVLASQVRR